jgi:hypothetical protein
MKFIEDHKLKTRVSDALNQSVQELLPEKIRTNYLVSWILNHSVLEEDDESIDRKYLNIENFVKLLSSSRKNQFTLKKVVKEQRFEENGFLPQIFRTSLTSSISFYYASLFHLGRQWKVSEQAIEATNKALEKNNLEKTVEQNYLLLQDDLSSFDILEEDQNHVLFNAFREVLETAQEQHSEDIGKAQKWWDLWLNEVSELEGIATEVENSLKDYKKYRYRDKDFTSFISLVSFSFQSKPLYQSFLENGVKFKESEVFERNNEFLILINLTCLSLFSALADDKYDRRDFWDLEQAIRHLQKFQHKQRYASIDQKIEEQLLIDFKFRNPFEQYGVLKSSVDQHLLDLWRKCKLPSGDMFYYAQNWLDSLDSELHHRFRELPFEPKLTDEHIESYARLIDSTIKRNWVSGSINTKDNTSRTNADLIQFLLEKECIVELVFGAVYPSRQKEGEQKWNVNYFREMIERIVQILNTNGYGLITPSQKRLERLWSLAISGNTYQPEW